MWGGYLLVLAALSIAPLSVVAPVRETAVVAVAVWGVWKLRERKGAPLKLLGSERNPARGRPARAVIWGMKLRNSGGNVKPSPDLGR